MCLLKTKFHLFSLESLCPHQRRRLKVLQKGAKRFLSSLLYPEMNSSDTLGAVDKRRRVQRLREAGFLSLKAKKPRHQCIKYNTSDTQTHTETDTSETEAEGGVAQPVLPLHSPLPLQSDSPPAAHKPVNTSSVIKHPPSSA